MDRFPSPYATKIWAVLGNGPVEIANLHDRARLTPDECQRGLNWLNHFGKVENFVEHGRAMMRKKES